MKKIICYCVLPAFYILFLCIIHYNVPNETFSERILKNENIADLKILGSKFIVFSDVYDVEIKMKNGDKVILHYVGKSLKNRGIEITQLNDIVCLEGRTYEIKKNKKVFYEPDDIAVLGKMLDIKLKSVGDVINHIEQLYELYELLESKSRTKFIYNDRFEVAADFKRLDTGVEQFGEAK